jgi:hypothetical protein
MKMMEDPENRFLLVLDPSRRKWILDFFSLRGTVAQRVITLDDMFNGSMRGRDHDSLLGIDNADDILRTLLHTHLRFGLATWTEVDA